MLRQERGREQAWLTDLLDTFQAAERAGADALGCWSESCEDPRLRGGLRIVAARDRYHAALTEARLRALGASPEARIGRELAAFCAVIADPGVSNRSKLNMLAARAPGDGAGPLDAFLARFDDDPESRALLEVIADDERSSVGWFRAMEETAPSAEHVAEAAREVIDFLDAFAAAEAAAADVLEAWGAVAGSSALAGGLGAIAGREAMHARILGDRVRALGATPVAALPPSLHAAARERFGAAGVPDELKLALLLARYPDDAAAAAPIAAMLGRLAGDPETRECLRLVAEGEVATIGWLRHYHRRLGERRRPTVSR
jgi:hypothetical protein